MKKYIISAMALLAMLVTSCSNEDITIEAPSTISVNAAGVISHFQEYKAGELEVMDSGRKLRLRALVYNSNGELVAQHTDYFTNYNVQLKTSEFLSPGTYTVIGISDVVKMQGNTVGTEWWTLSGERKLSDMVIKDQEAITLRTGNWAQEFYRVDEILRYIQTQFQDIETINHIVATSQK